MWEIAAGVCLGILAAAFLLGTRVGAAILSVAILGFAVLLLYLFWDTAIVNWAKFVGAGFLLMIIVGWSWIGLRKLGTLLTPLLPPPFGTKGKPPET